MHKELWRSVAMLWLGLWLLGGSSLPAAAADPVVRAVLFYSPSCGHCHHVIENVLLPLIEQYGEQFEVIGINVTDPGGQVLYQAAIAHYSIPPERQGVPTLIIGETVLVGSGEIPEQLPGLIETHLAEGGVDWPTVPGLAEALTTGAPEPTPTEPPAETPAPTRVAPAATPIPTATPMPAISGVVTGNEDWRDRFARDPLGNGISILVLLGLVVSVVYHGLALTRTPAKSTPRLWQWAVPPLIALGLLVAGYLAYVEMQQVTAVCGPVGDCNAVQQSEFARLLGVLPIAVLGLLGYVAIGAAWAVARWARSPWAEAAQLAMVGMAWFGVAFSIYLTFLEPFVIGATCAWCLTSAVVMTLLFWLIAPLARPTWRTLRRSTPSTYKETVWAKQ